MALGVREGEWPLCLMENGRTGMPAPTKNKETVGGSIKVHFTQQQLWEEITVRREEAGVMGLYWG